MEIIKTISFENKDIIKSILKLHAPDGVVECDVTYSKGVFYNNTGIQQPKYKYDIYPQTIDTIQADCRELPLADSSINCLMFDPPFMIAKGPSLCIDKDGSNIINKRFSCFENPLVLYEFYEQSLLEFYRVLKPHGVLIFKCQDTVSSGTQYMSHVYVHNIATKMGFYPKDLFILNAKSRLTGGKHKRQQHARKYYSYFWVFEKGNNKLQRIQRIQNMLNRDIW